MTDEQYLAWLASPGAIRCVLLEAGVRAGGVETVRYLSSAHYTTGPMDAPANTAYQAVISGGATITEKLSIDGSASLSFGDIEIGNVDGSRDTWLNDLWVNRPVALWLGDVRWPRADFRPIFSGTLAGIGSRDRSTLNLALRDKSQRLNTPMTEATLGGLTENKDRIKPLCFGECHNVTPLLIDPATLTYQIHDGPIKCMIEVRDDGKPVGYTVNLAAGTFSLTVPSFGVITASVQGDNAGGTYRNTIAALVKRIATGYGKAADRFAAEDIDADNFAAFEAGHPQPVGLYLADRTNVIQACADLAASVGAQAVVGSSGLLRLLKIALPAVGDAIAVGAAQMTKRSLHVADRPAVQASIKIGYCKNWTVQKNLLAGIHEEHKDLLAQEWLATAARDDVVAKAYRLTTDPVQIDTLLLTRANARAEAARRLALWSVQRTVYSYTGTPALMLETLGNAQTLTHPRYGLGAGVTGQIVGITRDWLAGRVQLEVLA